MILTSYCTSTFYNDEDLNIIINLTRESELDSILTLSSKFVHKYINEIGSL